MEKNKDKDDLQIKYKLMMLGEQAVGKSSLVLRYTKNKFQYNIMGTAGLDLKKKELKINDELINVVIYDSAGHDRFRKISEVQFKGSDGLILVYDTTEAKSFDWILEWLDKLKSFEEKNLEVLVVGNKIDLPNKVINYEDATKRMEKYDIRIMETSALTGENVEKAFQSIIETLHFKKQMNIINQKNNNIKTHLTEDNNQHEIIIPENKAKINLSKSSKDKKKKSCCKSQ